MAFFWVNLGKSYNEVIQGKFLWAPEYAVTAHGMQKMMAGWKPVKEVKAGDVIFCHVDKTITYVAIARKDAYESKQPKTRTHNPNNTNGFRIDVDLIKMLPAVSVDDFKPTLIAIHNKNCKPVLLTREGVTTQQYMIRLPQGAGALILSNLGDQEANVCEQSSKRQKTGSLTKGSNRETVCQARIGQGQFRESVLSLWQKKCPVTGLSKPELLVASHIVPWSLSDETQKVDPNNGFPFSPAVDKLFDRGYISFDDDGRLLVNMSVITNNDLHCLGVRPNARILGLNDEQKSYLATHREIFHF